MDSFHDRTHPAFCYFVLLRRVSICELGTGAVLLEYDSTELFIFFGMQDLNVSVVAIVAKLNRVYISAKHIKCFLTKIFVARIQLRAVLDGVRVHEHVFHEVALWRASSKGASVLSLLLSDLGLNAHLALSERDILPCAFPDPEVVFPRCWHRVEEVQGLLHIGHG